uniref:Uncharacterized protein n=1 Tax=Macrostomum lignano TaxID=282301 RepID=A0A1I8FR93_9PLAT
MATASPVATAAAPRVCSRSNRGTPQHQHHQNHRRQFYGVRIRFEEDPENFVRSQCRQSGKCDRRFRSIDREFAPKPPFRLPPSWIPIDHTSGLTMYLHKPTKVVTLARRSYRLRHGRHCPALSTDSPQSAEPQPQPQQQPAQDGIESGKEQLEVPNAAVAEDSPAAAPAPLLAPPPEDSDAEEGEITSSEDG